MSSSNSSSNAQVTYVGGINLHGLAKYCGVFNDKIDDAALTALVNAHIAAADADPDGHPLYPKSDVCRVCFPLEGVSDEDCSDSDSDDSYVFGYL